MQTVVVIGGGPAGMMAGITAAQNGARVLLVEKNKNVGKKLRITGKGKCNITAAVTQEELIVGYPGNGRFLFSAFNEFSNQDLIDYLNKYGLMTKIERGQRVFPASENANDVADLLYKRLVAEGCQVLTGKTVLDVMIKEGKVVGVKTNDGIIEGDAVIIATGGISYPGTGSTGDGYRFAENAGHNIVNPRPGLVPLLTREKWATQLQGLSLKNVKVSAYKADNSKLNEEFGEMMFTHFGVSGPIILSISRDIGEYIDQNKSPVTLQIDLKPALNEEMLYNRICRDLDKYSRKQFKNTLNDLLPRKLIPIIIELSGIEPSKDGNQVNKKERKQLVSLLKNLTVHIVGTRPVAEAIVTSGGVNVKEINPKTMESKLVRGLFFAGEVIDVDGYTGGYNLQAAFSTGHVAGKYAALRQ